MVQTFLSLLINKALPSLAFAAILTYLSIPWIEWVSSKRQWVAGHFKSQKSILGGAMIFSGMAVSWLAHDTITSHKVWILCVIAYFMILGFVDDQYRLKGRYKIPMHILGWILMGSIGVKLDYWQWAFFDLFGDLSVLSWPLSCLLGMAIMNSMSVLRRLDGVLCIYTGILGAVFGLCSLRFGQLEVVILSACLVGSCFSFYKYNRKPVRIYLGRSGLYVMGSTLSILAIQGVMNYTISSNLIIVLFMIAISIVVFMIQIKDVILQKRRRIRSFSYKNTLLNRHPMSQLLVKIISTILLVSASVVITCLILDIPLLMILIFVGGSIYGGLVTGLWWIPKSWIKRLLVCVRY